MKRTFAILLMLLATIGASGQRYAKEDYDFALYLLGNNLTRDAVKLAETETVAKYYKPLSLDSLNYIKGWTFYLTRRFDKAAASFDKVSLGSALYPKSTFFGAVSLLEQGDTEGAADLLNGFSDSSGEWSELLAVEKAGVALLRGDKDAFQLHRKEFKYNNFALTEGQRLLDEAAAMQPRRLSPFAAGALSAVVPGLGKVYAGNLGEGIASFLLVGAAGALTAESWIKAGTPKNWRTILYGSVGTLLYISNIFGSAASVRVYYKQFDENRISAVMYGIHIPLRTVFD